MLKCTANYSSFDQVVLELQEDRKLATSDDPPVVLGYLDGEILQKVSSIETIAVGVHAV